MTIETIRVFLTRHLFTSLGGFAFSDWLSILRRHFFSISPRYWPRAILMTVMSLQATANRKKDEKILSRTAPKPPDPLFVLGHWRSGTTHLHNLLALDPRWNFPDFVAVTQPHGFLSCQKQIRESRLMRLLTPKTRLIDNMSASLESPTEDEIALAILCRLSFAMGFVFPKEAGEFDRYLSFREATEEERMRWKAALRHFVGKLAIASEKPVVLKSPAHTARIRMILEVFPNARFVHVHRDPYEVFSSYRRSAAIMLEMMRLQNRTWENFDERILDQYRRLYDCFLEDKERIPPGRFTQISFRELDESPVPTLRRIYQDLGLGDSSRLEKATADYLGGLRSFSRISHQRLSAETVSRINSAWRPYFEAWGYAMRPADGEGAIEAAGSR
ncbi:MAG: sulfotransferase [Oligoflexia bacterium]|nr:sulfotransferase [Oligoflexia bacterium]